MPELTFTETDIPEITRDRKENPFTPVVKRLVENEGKALSFEMPRKTDKDEKALSTAISQIQRAGRDLSVTVRKSIATHDKKTGVAVVTIWSVPRITRERKPAETSE